MKRYVFVFVLGAAVGAVGHWYFTEGNGQRDWRQARERVSRGAGRHAENVRGAASKVWTNDIREELARSGMVVR
ncbi:MAG TPA: hypothetical protein VNO52_03760, partial [Methylomirabilota bacterium]|nr:hypothetical protein [Methylomirabilota bacterium]